MFTIYNKKLNENSLPQFRNSDLSTCRGALGSWLCAGAHDGICFSYSGNLAVARVRSACRRILFLQFQWQILLRILHSVPLRCSFKPVAVLEHWELRFRYPLIANEALRAATGALDHSAPIFGLNVLYLRRRFGCFEVFWELKVGTAVPTRQCDR